MPPEYLSRKHAVKKVELMLYKPLFSSCKKDLLKSYTVVWKQSISATKVGVAHAHQSFIKTLSFKFIADKWGLIVQ